MELVLLEVNVKLTYRFETEETDKVEHDLHHIVTQLRQSKKTYLFTYG